MDARIEPVRLLGLEVGDAHVLRNAGGIVTDDVLRSLEISHTQMGTRDVMVIGHTDCGAFPVLADVEENVRAGAQAIRESPALEVAVSMHVYDVATGELRELR